jgi:hypothetical protein
MIFACIKAFAQGFLEGERRPCPHIRLDRNMRAAITEDMLDRMLKETFPSSDPITLY